MSAALILVLVLLVLVLLVVPALLVLILVLILVLALLVLILIAIHRFSSSINGLRLYRLLIMPRFSGFIPGPEKKAGKKSRRHRCGNTPGGGFQTAGKNTQESVFFYCFPDTL